MNHFIDVSKLLFILFICGILTYGIHLIDTKIFGISSTSKQMLYSD